MRDLWGRAERIKWDIVWCDLPADLNGLTDFTTRQIRLSNRLRYGEERATLAHELEHAEHGPTLAGEWWQAREELRAERTAARKMISIEGLADTLAWTQCACEAAEELDVDEDMLLVRLKYLNSSEWNFLATRLG